METNKGKHLTIYDREYIQDALSSQCTLKEIADRLAKDSTTISKEIKRNRIFKQSTQDFSAGCANRKNCQVLLTLFFRNCSLMIAILMNDCTQDSVKNAIDTMYKKIGHQAFKECFPVILTDNGSEFKAPNTFFSITI
ncbi:MAG: helix-turn-helix domain-containing protein [Clostridia bacterium]|nr:helix-turn-helix domain-containing protein [Clostridia bacterium]